MNQSIFPPSEEFQKQAYVRSLADYYTLVDQAKQNPEAYWAAQADEFIEWFKPYDAVLNESEAPFYRWFEGGSLNASYLCLDRHLSNRGGQTALLWEGESGETRAYTYVELLERVNETAVVLQETFGITKGDRVVLYLPMIPEAVFAMLACARLGAMHVVVFGGFSAEVLRERIADTEAKLVITVDGASRHGKPYLLKPTVDTALGALEFEPKVLVVEHNNEAVSWKEGRDFRYRELVASAAGQTVEPVHMDSEDPLFILHTSGSTGKPKGIVHSTAGYMLWAQYTTKNVFDLHDNDVFWCTADIGWITGHTYTVYGPLALGRTTMLYEGTPTYPDTGRWWKNIEKHHVTQFYTAPTAIRLLHKDGPNEPSKYNLSSLKVLGTVGEPINPEAWLWYSETVGGGHCPVVDTWWQTETGGHIISPLPGATPTKPGSATLPLPGIEVEILDEHGEQVPAGEKGLLCITMPWPSMLRTVWNAPERYESTYFSTVSQNGKPVYFSGDGAYHDEDGYIVITGRVDDVINISGHRVGTAELESVVAGHPAIAEAAVVTKPDEIRGERIVAFVVTNPDSQTDEASLMKEVNQLLRTEISAMVTVSEVYFVPGLPKTRSGKILRRILRTLARNEPFTADISTLENPDIVASIKSILGYSL
jgi:acetyl-CoA synthetase